MTWKIETWKIEHVALALSILAFGVAAVAGWVYFDQRSQTQLSEHSIQTVIKNRQSILLHSKGDLVLGNRQGDVTLVEFSDYLCSVCKLVHPIVAKLLSDDGQVRLVIKEYPILGSVSTLAAQAALASREQGGYARFRKALMTARSLNDERIFEIAEEVGLDPERLRIDMAKLSDQIGNVLEANVTLAKDLGLQGTPAFVAGQTLVPGATSLAGLNHLISSARALKASR